MYQSHTAGYMRWKERMKTYKRVLTDSQALRRENAKHPRCTCRCSGALHGQGHASYQVRKQALMKTQKAITTEEVVVLLVETIQLRLMEIK